MHSHRVIWIPPSRFEETQRRRNEKQRCKCKKLATPQCEGVLSLKSISNGFLFSGVNTCSTVLFENVRVIQPSAKPGIIMRWVGLTIRTANKTFPVRKEKTLVERRRGAIISQELHISLTVWTFAPLSQFVTWSSICVTYNHITVATAANADAAASSF